MPFSYFLIAILIISIFSQPRFDVSFLTMTCYKSNSIPIQYLRVYHDFPIGPLLLSTEFTLEIQPLFQLPTSVPLVLKARYQFQRADEECRDTLLFTAAGIQFLQMSLKVNIFLFEKRNKIATMFYVFENGFNDGKYLILSEYTNFGIDIKVRNAGQEFIQLINEYLPVDLPALLLVKEDHNDICVVTNNNRGVVLRVSYENGKPPGFFLRIATEYKESGHLPDRYRYTAFECKTDEYFDVKEVAFIDNYSESTQLYFSVDSFLYENGSPTFKRTFIVLKNVFRVNIHKSFHLLPNIQRVYFLLIQPTTEYLPNGTVRLKFSVNGRLYHSVDLNAVHVLPNVIRRKFQANDIPIEQVVVA